MAIHPVPDDEHVGLIEATFLVAKFRQPDLWNPVRMLPGEQEVWDGLGSTLNGEFWIDHLRVRVRRGSETDQTFLNRIRSFSDAQNELRRALYGGRIVAEYIDDQGRFQQVDRHMWWTDDGETVVQRGTAYIDEGDPLTEVLRFVLLTKTDLDKQVLRTHRAQDAHGSLRTDDGDSSGLNRERPSQRPTKGEIEAAYSAWISQHKERQSPTSREVDVQHMKMLFPFITIGRVRELRNALAPADWKRPGRRKALTSKSGAESGEI